jgi:hypothetical protein
MTRAQADRPVPTGQIRVDGSATGRGGALPVWPPYAANRLLELALASGVALAGDPGAVGLRAEAGRRDGGVRPGSEAPRPRRRQSRTRERAALHAALPYIKTSPHRDRGRQHHTDEEARRYLEAMTWVGRTPGAQVISGGEPSPT